MAEKRILTVGRDDPPALEPFLHARLGLGRDEVRRLIAEGGVYVGTARSKDPGTRLHTGARVVLYLPVLAAPAAIA